MLTTSTHLICPACLTSVIGLSDKIHYARKIWHKVCFCCKVCSLQLNSLNVRMRDDDSYSLYCLRHYPDEDNVSMYSETSTFMSSYDMKSSRTGHTEYDSPLYWTVDDVARWLNDISLQQYEEIFRKHNIDGSVLLDEIDGVDNDIIQQLIPALGGQLKFRKALRMLRNTMRTPQRPSSAGSNILKQDSEVHLKLLQTIHQQSEHITSLISTVSAQTKHIEVLVTKMTPNSKFSPIDAFNKSSSVVQNQLLDLPSNISKIPFASADTPLSDVPAIDSVAPSVLSLPSNANIPSTTTPVPTSVDGPQGSSGVSFPAVIHPNIDAIAIQPVIDDKYNFQNYGHYTVTIFDQQSENVLVQTLVNVVPENEICMPKKFVLRDSVNNVLVGATVKLKLHDQVVFTGITDANGTIIMPTSLQKNCYEVEINAKDSQHKPSAFRMIVYENRGSDVNTQFICRQLESDQVEIVLKWDRLPRDLDSHLFVSDGRHVFYESKIEGNVSLDYDVTNGFGPETVKLTLESGLKYLYVVHRYSRDGFLTKSGATVTINNGTQTSTADSPYQIVQVPVVNQPDANFWIVFEIDGTTKNITIYDNEFEVHNNYSSDQIGLKYFNR